MIDYNMLIASGAAGILAGLIGICLGFTIMAYLRFKEIPWVFIISGGMMVAAEVIIFLNGNLFPSVMWLCILGIIGNTIINCGLAYLTLRAGQN